MLMFDLIPIIILSIAVMKNLDAIEFIAIFMELADPFFNCA